MWAKLNWLDIYKTLNTDTECSSAAYLSEMSSSKTGGKTTAHKKEQESFVTLTTRTVRGQEKFRRAKVRSLRITLLLILTYAVTWLPYNLLSWWMVLHFDSYRANLDSNYILNSLVVLNSVINPFIYGR
uniref:G_PROTEIN_RECEP_F1_2 domain-containing protein n=1 Tax=Caenorhabditis japonica TaxID=281687 RepID=A0A8R1IXA8_CAEJA